MKLRKILAILLALATAAILTGCGGSQPAADKAGTNVTIGVVGEAQEMWTPVIEALAKDGIHVTLKTFSDYATPNQALNDGDIDLNAFQHNAYFRKDCESHGYKLKAIGNTFISAMNIYSKTLTALSDVPEGAKVAIPNDATNEGRALKIMEAAGFLQIDPAAGDAPELTDITENYLNLDFVEVDAASIYALLPDVALGVINCNYALDNGLNPGEDALFEDGVSIYSGDSYINIIACREGDENNEVYQKIVAAYQCDAVKQVFATTFKGSYLPAWEDTTAK